MSRHDELLAMAQKSLEASPGPTPTRLQKQQQRLAELEYQMGQRCPVCGGLPSGLPPTCYDEVQECSCEE